MTTPLTRAIPSSGEQLPVVGLGTWQTFDVGESDAARAPLEGVLGTFVATGGTVVDSSPMYGRSEEVVGALAEELGLHDRLFVATKVWITGKTAGIRQMRESMRKLRASPLDLIQVHNLVDVDTHLDTLQEWKEAGLVRYLGITHYTAAHHQSVLDLLESRPVDFVQINYSAVEREAERGVLPAARDRGIAVLVNRPFAEGALVRRLRSRALPAWAGELGCRSWPQLLLKFVIAHPAVTCVIPATSSVEHLRDNMAAGSGPMPDEAMRERIASAVSGQ